MRRATAIHRSGKGVVTPVFSTGVTRSASASGCRAGAIVSDAGCCARVHLLCGKVTIASLALTTAVSTSGSIVAADGKLTTLKTGTTSVFHGNTVATFAGGGSSVVVE